VVATSFCVKTLEEMICTDKSDWERELIERVRRGDLRAYARLVKTYEDRMFYTAYRILHHREDAEDCLQETFVRAWERLSGLSDPRAFSTWLYRILSNLALDMLRKRERDHDLNRSVREGVVLLPTPRSTLSPREALRRAREAERIESAIDNLAPKQKVVFVLRHFQNLKIREIAEVLDNPEGTIKATLHAALGKLRKALVDLRSADERRSELR